MAEMDLSLTEFSSSLCQHLDQVENLLHSTPIAKNQSPVSKRLRSNATPKENSETPKSSKSKKILKKTESNFISKNEHGLLKSSQTTPGIDKGPSPSMTRPSNLRSVHVTTNAADRPLHGENSLPSTPNMSSRRKKEFIEKAAVDQLTSGVETDNTGDEDKLLLTSWGLPDIVLDQYRKLGITAMFPWQAECLCTGSVLDGGNLVYSAPTSAGKTMVAELLVLKKVLETKRKALFILPFVSVAREKMFYLQKMFQDVGVRVNGFMGSHSPAGGFSNVDIAVCTIEKGNSLINRLIEEDKLHTLGIIVVDELHLIGDPHRGYLLELMLTKVCYASSKKIKNNPETNASPVQIVGMSATLPNLGLLSRWLKADLYHTDFRPVPLSECVKIGTAIFDSGMLKLRDLDTSIKFKGDEDHIIPLCLETLQNGHSVLIFCPTKNWCEKLSESIAKEFYQLLKQQHNDPEGSTKLKIPLDKQALSDTVEQLRRTPVGLDSVLGRTVYYSVAYHHAGLTFDERDIVEGAFRQGILKVLIATSTLSSGVNLPARRVIIRTPSFHGGLIDFLTYKQMIGRAGRKGVDTAGESILVCKPNERSKAVTLVTASLPPVKSCLIKQDEGLSSSVKRAILEIVVSGLATSVEDVIAYVSCTMLAASAATDSKKTAALIQTCLQFLQDNEFVTVPTTKPGEETTARLTPTQLGAAVLASALSPDEGLLVFAELSKARRCFVLESELHVIYLVTPIYTVDIAANLNWYNYYCMWEHLSADMKLVADLVGVQESFLARAIRGRVPQSTAAQVRTLSVHKRFYTALVLQDLVQEVALTKVASKYNCNKGQLQSLQQSAATFAGMRELCDLVRITSLNGRLARVLYNSGYQTVAALANADLESVSLSLRGSSPFQSNKKQDNETDWDLNLRRKARCVWLTGRKGMTEDEAATAIIQEAKDIIAQNHTHPGRTRWDKCQLEQQDEFSYKASCLPYYKSPPISTRVSNSRPLSNRDIGTVSKSPMFSNRHLFTDDSEKRFSCLPPKPHLLIEDSLEMVDSDLDAAIILDNSYELIAASNFERNVDSENDRMNNSASNNSYVAREEKPIFYKHLQDDLAFAMDMSDSFSSMTIDDNVIKTETTVNMADSFTVSMMDNALNCGQIPNKYVTSDRDVSKRLLCTPTGKTPKTRKTKDKDHSTPEALKRDQTGTCTANSKRKISGEEIFHDGCLSNNESSCSDKDKKLQNESPGSDCIPPTPPGDSSKVMSPYISRTTTPGKLTPLRGRNQYETVSEGGHLPTEIADGCCIERK
ncbi:hypothetical protein ScPMuIL_011953 [Solemya velum]